MSDDEDVDNVEIPFEDDDPEGDEDDDALTEDNVRTRAASLGTAYARRQPSPATEHSGEACAEDSPRPLLPTTARRRACSEGHTVACGPP